MLGVLFPTCNPEILSMNLKEGLDLHSVKSPFPVVALCHFEPRKL